MRKPESVTVGRYRAVPRRPPRHPGDGWAWFLRWSEGGARHEHSLGRLAPSDVLVAAMEAIRSGVEARPSAVEIVTVADLMGAWLGWQETRGTAGEIRPRTLRDYRGDAEIIVGHLGDARVTAITGSHVADLRTSLRAMGRADTTARKIAGRLLEAHRWALDRGRIETRPLRARLGRATPKTAQRPATGEELDAVLALLTPRLSLFVRVLAATGMRPAELETMRLADLVDERHGSIVVTVFWLRDTEGAKTGPRSVPIPSDLARELRSLPWRRVADPEARIFGRRTAEAVRQRMRDAGSTWTLYALRKAFVTRAYASGTTPRQAADIVGHAPEVAVGSYMASDVLGMLETIQRARLDRGGRVLAIGGSKRGHRRADHDDD